MTETSNIQEKSRQTRLGTVLPQLARAMWFRAVLALAAVITVWWIYPPRMASGEYMLPWDGQLLRDIFFERSIFGLLAIGMTFVIIGGGIDLSVGSVLGMTAICFAVFTLRWHWAVAPAVAATMGVGAAAGLLNGLWVANLGLGLPLMSGVLAAMMAAVGGWAIQWAVGLGLGTAGVTFWIHGFLRMSKTMQPFAATLAMMVIARGAAKWFSGSAKVQSADSPVFYSWLTSGRIPPLIVIFLGVGVVAWVLLQYTRTGRHIYAIGGNAEAARLSGVGVRSVTALTYVFCGVTAALAGIATVARTTLGDPESGTGYELDAIAAVVIGGTGLSGGRGGILLTLLGVLTIGFLEKYLSLQGWETWGRLMAKGAIIVLAVAMQRQINSR